MSVLLYEQLQNILKSLIAGRRLAGLLEEEKEIPPITETDNDNRNIPKDEDNSNFPSLNEQEHNEEGSYEVEDTEVNIPH
jgi:hypothetical protein